MWLLSLFVWAYSRLGISSLARAIESGVRKRGYNFGAGGRVSLLSPGPGLKRKVPTPTQYCHYIHLLTAQLGNTISVGPFEHRIVSWHPPWYTYRSGTYLLSQMFSIFPSSFLTKVNLSVSRCGGTCITALGCRPREAVEAQSYQHGVVE
jgi:hypothetical protein